MIQQEKNRISKILEKDSKILEKIKAGFFTTESIFLAEKYENKNRKNKNCKNKKVLTGEKTDKDRNILLAVHFYCWKWLKMSIVS